MTIHTRFALTSNNEPARTTCSDQSASASSHPALPWHEGPSAYESSRRQLRNKTRSLPAELRLAIDSPALQAVTVVVAGLEVVVGSGQQVMQVDQLDGGTGKMNVDRASSGFFPSGNGCMVEFTIQETRADLGQVETTIPRSGCPSSICDRATSDERDDVASITAPTEFVNT